MRRTSKGLPPDRKILPDPSLLQVSAGVHFNDGYHVRGYLRTAQPRASECHVSFVPSNGYETIEFSVPADMLPVLGDLLKALNEQAKRDGLVPTRWPKRPRRED